MQAPADSADAIAPGPAASAFADAQFPTVWLDAVDVRLAGDNDGDGFHSRLQLTLDVDTDLGYAQVYASIALVDGQGRLAVAYDTDAFGVDGRSSFDEKAVEFELLDDFPTDRYSLFVEVRDARYGDALDGVGANEFSSLARLRLEGTDRDGHGYGSGFAVSFASGYGSSFGGSGFPRDDGFGQSGVAFASGVSYAGAADPSVLLLLGVAAVATRALRRRRD